MAILHYLSYIAALAAFSFIVLSLASGLLYISELIEEHSRFAKYVGKRGIYGIIGLQIALYFTDSLPLTKVLFSVICHLVYVQNIGPQWPFISLTSPVFLTSCVLVICNHFLWFFHFANVSQEARHRAHRPYGRPSSAPTPPSFGEVATFFTICVWLSPLFLFLSLSANDNALPMITGDPGTPTTPYTSMQTRPRSSLLRSLLGFRKKDEGIIAPPRSPIMTPITTPGLGVPALNNIPSRPSSPHAQFRSPSLEFRLDMPPPPRSPRRADTSPNLGVLGPGIGMRRAPSSSALSKEQ